MEAKWSQSMALGLTNVRPQLQRQERGRDLKGLVMGYDLPKIYVDSKEARRSIEASFELTVIMLLNACFSKAFQTGLL